MKKIVYTVIATVGIFVAFAGVASAQVYYPPPAFGQISWGAPQIYQPVGIPVTNPYYNPPRPWAPVFPSQPQGVCVTGCGAFGGGFSGFNSGVNISNGYYPNGFTYRFTDRIVNVAHGHPVIRSRVQAGTFIPF